MKIPAFLLALLPAASALAAAASGTYLINPSLDEGDTTPAGWRITWRASGNLLLVRDTETKAEGEASLRFESTDASGYGSASQELKGLRGAATIRGRVKAEGSADLSSQLAVQVFDATGKQIDWVILSELTPGDPWGAFEQSFYISPEAASANLVLMLKGQGKVWVDKLQVETPAK